MHQSLFSLLVCLSVVACAHADPLPTETAHCALTAQGKSALSDWRERGFETDTPDSTAIDLASCLNDPDPFLRDRIGYEGLTATLRAGGVSEDARRLLIAELIIALEQEDTAGFHAPFAALALAELARTDRIDAFLSDAERTNLARSASRYLEGVTDYRAFSDTEGWRHGVAHGADFAMQLALNSEVEATSLIELRDAITSQIKTQSEHAFTHGEPERLTRPILFMAMQGKIEADSWAAWFEALAAPAPLEDWGDAFSSETALVRLHNLKAFAQSLYINASLSENPNLEPIETGALEVLKALP